mgnify:CR=1 FL=1
MGCKDYILEDEWQSLDSFTLTMWDVKSSGYKVFVNGLEFYLNYVGCKAHKIRFISIPKPSFYLNYVGCKVFIESCNCKCDLSFTLTMWDVKRVEIIIKGVKWMGFTLTMWDVKFSRV